MRTRTAGPLDDHLMTGQWRTAALSGNCLHAWPFNEGYQAEVQPCDDWISQHFYKVPVSGNWFMLENISYGHGLAATRQCLDVAANGQSKVVQTWLCGPISPPKGNQMCKYKVWAS